MEVSCQVALEEVDGLHLQKRKEGTGFRHTFLVILAGLLGGPEVYLLYQGIIHISAAFMNSVAWLLLICVLLNCLCCTCSTSSVGSVQQQQTLQYLQGEISALSAAQQQIASFLRNKRISIGLPVRSFIDAARSENGVQSRIAVSTEDNMIECRVSLGKAPVGAKCVAPCACTGSQKWVQFSELNRLRRKDPEQWTVCRTCLQRFDYQLFDREAGLAAHALGYALDHRGAVRAACLVAITGLLSLLPVHRWAARLLTSRALWMKVGRSVHTFTFVRWVATNCMHSTTYCITTRSRSELIVCL